MKILIEMLLIILIEILIEIPMNFNRNSNIYYLVNFFEILIEFLIEIPIGVNPFGSVSDLLILRGLTLDDFTRQGWTPPTGKG